MADLHNKTLKDALESPRTITSSKWRNSEIVHFTVGDLVTAISDQVGEGMLYRIEKFRSYRNSANYEARVVPVFSIWGARPLKDRKSKWFFAKGLERVSLQDLGKTFAEFGLFIRSEAKRLSEADTEGDHDKDKQERDPGDPHAGDDVRPMVAREVEVGNVALLAQDPS